MIELNHEVLERPEVQKAMEELAAAAGIDRNFDPGEALGSERPDDEVKLGAHLEKVATLKVKMEAEGLKDLDRTSTEAVLTFLAKVTARVRVAATPEASIG